MTHTVGEIARLAGITVRTLHHYDQIGLVSPRTRSDAGYRLYDDADVARLQQVLFYRATGMPLDDIARVMTDPSFDRGDALRDQRTQLEARVEHLLEMIDAVDAGPRPAPPPTSFVGRSPTWGAVCS